VQSGFHLVKPLRVVERKSTDILAVEDKKICSALAFIRNHACENIKISDVLRMVPMSRRAFEARFYKAVDRSPHKEIIRVRLDRIKQLLIDTDLSLALIAERTGFEHAEYMNDLFKKNAGLSPGKYRSVHRASLIAGRSLPSHRTTALS
jgi:LacI family transcriptional regulator